jgi:hypothetical protein
MGLVPGNGEAGKSLRCGEPKLTERQEDGRRAVGRCSVPRKSLLSGDELTTMPSRTLPIQIGLMTARANSDAMSAEQQRTHQAPLLTPVGSAPNYLTGQSTGCR